MQPYGGQVVKLQVFLMVGRGLYPHTGCFFTVYFHHVFFTLTQVAGSTRLGQYTQRRRIGRFVSRYSTYIGIAAVRLRCRSSLWPVGTDLQRQA